MNQIRLLSASAQVAAHLLAELERSRWTDRMPGVNWLATELGVNRKTVVAALAQLEKEGLLSNQGQGRKRRIVPPKGSAMRLMRIAILEYDSTARTEGYMVALQHLLLAAGQFSGARPTDRPCHVSKVFQLRCLPTEVRFSR